MAAQVAVRYEVAGGRLWVRSPGELITMIPWGPRTTLRKQVAPDTWESVSLPICLHHIEQVASGEKQSDIPGEVEASRFLVSQWPEDLRHWLRPLADIPFELIKLAAHHGELFLNMIHSHPPLAYAVAARRQLLSPDGIPNVGDILSRRRRDIVAAFGLPATESAVNLLRKIPAGALNRTNLSLLLSAVRRDSSWIRRLAHVHKIGATLIHAISARSPAELLKPRFSAVLGEFDGLEPRGNVIEALREVGRYATAAQIAAIHDLASLQRVLRQLRPAPAAPLGALPRVFPPPPFAGNTWIEPIRTREELVEEGRRQHNCSALFADRIAGGAAYFYRILHPERATLCLVRTSRRWKIDQLRTGGNGNPAKPTQNLVRAWIEGVPVPDPFALTTRPARRRRVNAEQLTLQFDLPE